MRLPDHDFAVGSRHLLVPSVMATCNIDKDGVSYNGDTDIAQQLVTKDIEFGKVVYTPLM